jgi:hypothetical protein
MKASILCSFCYSEIVFDSFEKLEAEMVKQYQGGLVKPVPPEKIALLDLSTFLCVDCLNDTQDHGIDMDDDMDIC